MGLFLYNYKNMTWFYFVILSITAGSIANLLNKVLMKDDKSDPMLSSIFFQFLLAFFFFFLSLIKGFVMPPIFIYPLNFILNGFLYGLGTFFTFKALKYIEVSEYGIIYSFGSIVTVISSTFFLKESFNLSKSLGLLLIIISIIAVSKTKKFKINKGVWYALGTAVFYGLAITNDSFLIKRSDTFSYLSIISFLPGLVLFLISPKSIKKINYYFNLENFFKLLIFSIFYTIASIGFYLAIVNGGQTSQVGSISKSQIILTTILAAVFLGERDRLWQKIIYGVLVIIGVILIK